MREIDTVTDDVFPGHKARCWQDAAAVAYAVFMTSISLHDILRSSPETT